MVQITHARTGYTDDRKPVLLPAADFDKETDGQKACLCPDENCPARLVHHKKHSRLYYNQFTGAPFKLSIPAYYQRHPDSPQHSPSCTAADHYRQYQSYARDLGGLSLQEGAFVYNLNIPVNDAPAPIRRSRHLSENFARQSPSLEEKDTPHVRRKLSEGVSNVKGLAGLLDKTQFEKGYRDSILLRNGASVYTLADVFEDDALALFRREHSRSKSGNPASPVLAQFKPIPLARFHSKQHRTIQGQSVTVRGDDGHDYSVSVKLHCGTKENFEAVKKDIAAGRRSFLVYAEAATVDLLEFAQKKKEIKEGKAQDRAVFVHVRINMPEQIAPWTPFNGQLDLEQAGMDLPLQPKPPREIPAHLSIK